jgi:hypothetical protein
MSIADAMRVIALENRVLDLAESNRVLVARVAALEDHLVDFQAAVEARQALEISAATGSPSHPIPAPQQPSRPRACDDAKACPSCERRREQAQVRLRRHRAKITAANGKTLEMAPA